MSKLRMSKEQLNSLKIRTTQMCGCVPELLWMRALNPRKNTQFSPHAGYSIAALRRCRLPPLARSFTFLGEDVVSFLFVTLCGSIGRSRI